MGIAGDVLRIVDENSCHVIIGDFVLILEMLSISSQVNEYHFPKGLQSAYSYSL